VGLSVRFAQHIGDLAKTFDWAAVYVIPLSDDTPTMEVRWVEGRIGCAVGPKRNKALPRIT
jgi:hypothetical protein